MAACLNPHNAPIYILSVCRNNHGDFDESCKLPCDCANGGSCTPDGCLCPDGWTGMDCSFPQGTVTYRLLGKKCYNLVVSLRLYISEQLLCNVPGSVLLNIGIILIQLNLINMKLLNIKYLLT